MVRVPDIPFEQLTDAQRRVFRKIAKTRNGHVRGPFGLWIRNPELADRASEFGNALRVHGKLNKRLFELTVLLVARHWSAQYEWSVHEHPALEAGVSREIVEAIRAGRAPSFVKQDEKLIFDIVSQINEKCEVNQATYDRAVAELGVDLLIELVTAVGFYTTIAMVVTIFDAPVPEGEPPLPQIGN
ncbi:MAG: carboxymuconolactone decarboxylase [Chloroflexi bacterium]|nr:carboxymuconolactone decarboxylase [Chloroflexota bacterium]